MLTVVGIRTLRMVRVGRRGRRSLHYYNYYILNQTKDIITPCFICRQALVDYCNLDLEIIMRIYRRKQNYHMTM